ncbi:MAG: hypothetical protein U9R00_03235, partial [Patescibacteria group bacterium]|nr:hypothetical protein [Patescibacteria group bacterium]
MSILNSIIKEEDLNNIQGLSREEITSDLLVEMRGIFDKYFFSVISTNNQKININKKFKDGLFEKAQFSTRTKLGSFLLLNVTYCSSIIFNKTNLSFETFYHTILETPKRFNKKNDVFLKRLNEFYDFDFYVFKKINSRVDKELLDKIEYFEIPHSSFKQKHDLNLVVYNNTHVNRKVLNMANMYADVESIVSLLYKNNYSPIKLNVSKPFLSNSYNRNIVDKIESP